MPRLARNRPPAMQVSRQFALLALVFAVLAQACDKDDDLGEVTEGVARPEYPGVAEELWPYFTAYEAAAASRGVDIDLRELGVVAHLRDITEEGVAGECTFNPANPNVMTVDAEVFGVVSERFREYIIFHELGHCERLRAHREEADGEGICVSIMASGTGECRDSYTAATREELLDELFDESFYGEWPQ